MAEEDDHPVDTLPTPCREGVDITETDTETETETDTDTRQRPKQLQTHGF